MTKLIEKAFSDTNKEVYAMVNDVRFSGSTCVSVLTYGKKVYVANVGDSRAIVIRQKADGILGYPISRDHKPDDPDE
jgi:serine/threonine protein phosphatase PrpC